MQEIHECEFAPTPRLNGKQNQKSTCGFRNCLLAELLPVRAQILPL